MKWTVVALLAALYPVAVIFWQLKGHKTPMRQTPAAWGAKFEHITYRTADGLTLKGWWIPGRGERAVLLLHGKGGSRNGEISGVFELAERYWRAGWNVMLADMRAHGESEGACVTFGVQESRDMLGWLNTLDVHKRYRWRLHGFSMGAVTALMMMEAEPNRFEAVVADGPWIDFEALVKQELWKRAKLPAWCYGCVSRLAGRLWGQDFRLADNRARVRRLCGRPVLYVFETEDILMPPYQRDALKHACSRAKLLLFGGAHVTAFQNDPDGYVEAVESALASLNGSLR